MSFVFGTLAKHPPVAVHTVTGHRVAMKFISKHVINMTKTKTRVQREVEYMRTLRHPHIIKLYVLLFEPCIFTIQMTFNQLRSNIDAFRYHHRFRICWRRTIQLHRQSWQDARVTSAPLLSAAHLWY
jgi:serine/threonine protein kinase